MRLFYCPECGNEEIENRGLLSKDKTLLNIRDGFGRPITHYKCKCGNYLAGSMDITGKDDDFADYCKNIIKEYNKGGLFYGDDMLEKAKKNWELNQDIKR